MKKLITMLSLLIITVFAFTSTAQATKNYNSELSDILLEICDSSECRGDIINGKLILIGKDSRKHVAPDGTYTDDNGKTIRVIDGKVIKKADRPMKRGQ